jgi:OFA family oxalate/formate antiporter-like MFS transporter
MGDTGTVRADRAEVSGRVEPTQAERWQIALAATVMQGAIGVTYAWSVFRDPLAAQLGSSVPDVTWAYSLNVFGLGLFAFLGGLWMRRVGPRTVGVTAGLLYGLGLLLAGLAGDRLWALYLGFGVLGGIGRGLGWVVPVAMAVQWFPDRRGLISGLSLAGNGVGALIAAPLAAGLIESLGVLPTLAVFGVMLLIVVVGAALMLREPPVGYLPPGWEPAAAQAARWSEREHTVRAALRTPQWYGLWALLFMNSSAGLALFSHAAPMAREMTGIGAMAAAGVVAVMSIANALGRLGWAWLSDCVGRRVVFVTMALVMAAALRSLPLAAGIVPFTILACTAMLSFGGGLGTMPAWAADYFGPKHVGPIMGLLMTAQGCGALVGPLFQAHVHEASGSYGPILSALALALVLSGLLPLALRPPGRTRAAGAPLLAARLAR